MIKHRRFSMNYKILGIGILGLFIIVAVILEMISGHVIKNRIEQNLQMRWSGDVVQLSAFVSVDYDLTQDYISTFEKQVDSELLSDSIEAENDNARIWIDAYSAEGEITLVSEKSTLTSNAIGVGGDFFLFHPLDLINGSYFSEGQDNQDFVILDEEAAWQLFGSNDIVGQQILIGNVPHFVAGVIKREDNKVINKAGLDKTTVYVSYNSLNLYGTNGGIKNYEVLLPEPVDGFAQNLLEDKFGVDESQVTIVNNTTRYSKLSLLKVFLNKKYRSMSLKSIVYPYWENEARYYEDWLANILIWELVLLFIPFVILLVFLVNKWIHKKWKMKDVGRWCLTQLKRLWDRIKKTAVHFNKSEYDEIDSTSFKKDKVQKEKSAIQKHILKYLAENNFKRERNVTKIQKNEQLKEQKIQNKEQKIQKIQKKEQKKEQRKQQQEQKLHKKEDMIQQKE